MPNNDSQRDQIVLLPPSIDEWVASDDPVRLIDDILSEVRVDHLRGGGSKSPGNAYSPRILLSAWIFGYFRGIHSSRQLERACRENIRFIWLMGGCSPDHNTLWRFFKDNRGIFEDILKTTAHMCLDAGLLQFTLHAVDGTKIPAVSSNRSGMHRKALLALEKKLDESIRAMVRKVEEAGPGEPESEGLAAELQDARQRRQTVRTKLEALRERGKANHHPAEPEAAMVKTTSGLKFGYNAQAIVDTDSGVVVAADVRSEGNDSVLLNPMIDKVRDTVGREANLTVADNGYFSYDELRRAHDLGRGILVATGRRALQHEQAMQRLAAFHADESSGDLICDKGGNLKYSQKRKSGTRYVCRRGQNCLCKTTKDGTMGRMITINSDSDLMAAMIALNRSIDGRQALQKRKCSIELTFAQVKSNRKFGRFTARGRESAKAQWNLLMAVVNLGKILLHASGAPGKPPPGRNNGKKRDRQEQIPAAVQRILLAVLDRTHEALALIIVSIRA